MIVIDERKCIICSKTWVPAVKPGKRIPVTCSRPCHHERLRRYAAAIRKCRYCGDQPVDENIRSGRAWFCTEECKTDYHRERNRIEEARQRLAESRNERRLCKVCAIPLPPRSPRHKPRLTCSQECYRVSISSSVNGRVILNHGPDSVKWVSECPGCGERAEVETQADGWAHLATALANHLAYSHGMTLDAAQLACLDGAVRRADAEP